MKSALILAITAAFAFAINFAIAGEPSAVASPSPAAASPVASPAAQKYTCEMHPTVSADKPGKCPICGMTLIPKKDDQKKN